MAMTKDKHYGGLDAFKIIASLLVICIHTSPLSSFGGSADFLLTRVIARIAVPFFLMVTGCFILPQYLFEKGSDFSSLLGFIEKATLLYAIATAVYIPVNLYAGHFNGLGVAGILRMILFDGTFYHLWYLPACILGILLVYLLSRKLPFKGVLKTALLLYGVGLLGDSYFGVVSGVPVISSIYDAMFNVFSYTRNGFFYAPVFLVMGAWFGHSARLNTVRVNAAGFIFSMIIMSAEGFVLHHFGLQRHDSMYIALLPCMYFLYPLVLSWNRKPEKSFRTVSTWIYLMHPLFIIIVRGAARKAGMEDVLVQNSLIHYLSVSALSVLFAVSMAKLPILKSNKDFKRGRAWIELDRAALHHNVNVLCSLLPHGCQLMPVVKADAYGHGAVLISQELNKMGVRAFCVASVLEGVELRKNKIKGEILILGYTHPWQFHYLCRYHLTQTVIECKYAETLNQYGKKIKVHIAIDTGMHRLGERCDNINDISKIFGYHNLKIEGIYTHMCADDTAAPEYRDFTLKQGRAFYNVVSQLKEQGFVCPKIHLQASYGLLNYPELAGDYARVGIALYGMLSTSTDTENCTASLKPVLSVKARVALVKDIFKGEAAGYGLQFVAKQDTRIAVLAIGYADGIPRSLSCGVGKVLIHGHEAPIIGRICMDQTLVDVSGILNVQAGDIAVVIGKSGNIEITACDIAKEAGTISNEILSRLGKRLERQMI
jgi:serine/alanine racemase